ncbi:MAG TPA: recombinase family protein [Thermoleophilaceae bacterium]|nr:recombinase family protein [Thermoleophilaceae bacterium]
MPLRLDGYIRVSRVGAREGEGYISPSVQRDAIKGYASNLGGEIVAWHDDQNFSGGSVERPDFQRVLERLRSGDTDGIVVMRVDRFARSVADGAAIVREITDRGQVFASCHERIDPRTPEGRYMLTSFLANAELFLDQTKAGWQTSKARAVARGAPMGPTPIGYERIPKGEPRAGCFVPDPVYGPAVSQLFKRAATRQDGDSALARWMTEQAPRRSGAPWQASEVRRWLSNRVYLGEVHYGELANTDAHAPLTDPEIFERCQREAGTQRRPHSSFLLSGLLRCAACRYSMGGFSYGGASQSTPVYRCSRARNGGCAEASVITARSIEDHVRGLVLDQLRGLELPAAEGIDLDVLEEAYENAEAELQAFASDLNARRALGDVGWQQALAGRATDRDAKREARDRAFVESQLATVARHVDDLGHDELRDLPGGMVRHVFVRRRPRGATVSDRVLVVWSDDPRAIDVPGPHRSGPFEPVRW